MNSRSFARQVAEFLRENKAEDVLILDVAENLGITDYFVIVTGRSNPHINFLQSELKQHLSEQYDRLPASQEGTAEQGWLLSDYEELIVHFFSEKKRAYYDLESLWADAEVVSA